MAEVIRWSTGEDMMNTTLEGETQASPLPSPRAALSASHTRVGARHGFDLHWNGWPGMGQPNRCCFETTDSIPVSNIFQNCRRQTGGVSDRYNFHLSFVVTPRGGSEFFTSLCTSALHTQAAILCSSYVRSAYSRWITFKHIQMTA